MELDIQRIREQINRWLPRLMQYKYALIVLFVGVLMLCFGRENKPQTARNPPQDTEQAAFQLAAFETRLEGKLAQIEGVGRVELMLSLAETGETVYVSDIRQSENGAQNRSFERALSTVSDGSYGEQPVRMKETCPRFRGAVVVCDGAGRSGVRLAVTQAVGAVCGLGADRISVIQMQS